MENRITLLGSHDNKLRSWLQTHPKNHERGALVLFKRLNRDVRNQIKSPRYISVDVIEMKDDWILSSSKTNLKINMRNFPKIYFRCEQEKLELGFVHSHPTGARNFSEQDNINEQNILKGLAGCNGKDAYLISMILCDGQWLARIRQGKKPEELQKVRHVTMLSETFDLDGVMPQGKSEILARQEAAFGKPFNDKLKSLRIAVVGGGGTGSSVATLLARAGVGELIIVDGDVLEETNLNRVRGYLSKDVGKNKAVLLSNFIENIGLGTKVSNIDKYLHESSYAIDAISSCDAVFGCTDDLAGRDVLNQALYYYALVYIDVGLTGRIDVDDEKNPYLRDHRGRISTILPEFGACLRCQRVVTHEKLIREQAFKDNPELKKLDNKVLREEYYLIGGGEAAPGVGPFTSATADYAVATLMDLMSSFRELPNDLRKDNIWLDFVHMTIHSNEPVEDYSCFCCGHDGIKAQDEGQYRLSMPGLGKIEEV